VTGKGSLHGIRVIEHGGFTAACSGKLLAEAGADVVRVIPPGGDPLATEPPFVRETAISIQDTWYNLGKRKLELDLTADEGRRALEQLLAGADILIDEWQAATDPVAGATDRFPALVRVSVTHAGYAGPRVVTNDLVANALCGSASVTGDAHTPPLAGYGNQTHHTLALYAGICALAGIFGRRATGIGTHIDLCAQEALASCTEQVLMQWLHEGFWERIAKRQGSLHWTRAYAVYPDRHGQGVQVTAAMRFMEEVLPWMAADGMAGNLTDPERYPNYAAIVRGLPEVMDTMRRWVATKDAEPFFYESQARHLPFGIVLNIPSTLKSPQIAARQYFQELEVPGAGPVPVAGPLVPDGATPRPKPATAVAIRDVAWDPRPSPPNGRRSGSRPLDGLRVLDFTHVLAGPFGTRVLADLGAEVLKVGTASRATGANNPTHGYYRSWNRNKKSLSLNLATAKGREITRALALQCDAIIENFSAGVLARWGLDRASLAAEHPRITVVSMGGMGQTGPWKDFVTYAPTIHALTGLTYLTNPRGEQLIGYGFSLTDHLSGLAGAYAILAGAEHARRTGQGLAIDLAQYELGLGLMAPTLIDHLVNGTVHEADGNRHPFAAWAPHAIYRCAGEDRWVAIAARGDGQWARLCDVMGRDDLAVDTRFASHAGRVQHADALDAIIESWTAVRDRYEVMALLQAAGLAAGAVQDAQDLAEHDPVLRERGFLGWAEPSSGAEGYGIDRFPAYFDGRRPATYRAAHPLGADTFETLTGLLGMTEDEVASLFADGTLS
jgi:crotonobetainyl-CoA:carnitine CoA-transferase CaiB-like acyl-CoA transferase